MENGAASHVEKECQNRPIFLSKNGHFAGKSSTACSRGGEIGDRKVDFDLSDGGEGDGNDTISTFPGNGMDVVRGSSRGDGEYAEV
jgi:hypothetical protein